MILEPDPLHPTCAGQTSGGRLRLALKLHTSVRSTFGRESAVHDDILFVILHFARDIGCVDVRAFNKGLVGVWINSFRILLSKRGCTGHWTHRQIRRMHRSPPYDVSSLLSSALTFSGL